MASTSASARAAASVPPGLIFYHFKTKMDLLLAVVQDREVLVLDDVLPPLPAEDDLPRAGTARPNQRRGQTAAHLDQRGRRPAWA
jgi:AcrR family transcriptional regulator